MPSLQVNIGDVSPFLRAEHGHVFCAECDEGRPLLTPENHAIVVMRGMLHGSLEEMSAQADYVMARVEEHDRDAVAVIETDHASFRFPDALLRALISTVRKHEKRIQCLYFLGLSRIVRVGFRLFAAPFLGAEMRNKVRMVRASELVSKFGASASLREWGGAVEFDMASYIERRATIEGVTLSLNVRPFDTALLQVANDALREEARRRSGKFFDNGSALFQEQGEKKGSGGLFGSAKWKSKLIVITEEALAYASSDADLQSDATIVEHENVVEVALEDNSVRITTRDRDYLFRFDTAEVAHRCFEILRQKSISTDETMTS